MKPFQYYLLEEDGRSIKVQNGVVTSTSTPTPLPHTPDKWQEIAVSWERDLNKHGIVRNFSTGIDYVRDGAKIIRQAFYTRNVERRVYLLIQRLTLDLDSNFFRWVYKYFYKGEIDMSTVNDSDFTTSLNIMEGNLLRKVKAFEDTQYTIPVDDDSENRSVKMDGIKFKQEAKFTLVDDIEITTNSNGHIFLPFILTNGSTSGIGTTGFKSQDLDFEDFSPAALDYIDNSLNWFHQNNTEYVQQVKIVGRFYGFAVIAGGFSPKFLISTQATENTYELVPGGINLASPGDEVDVNVDMTITLQPGENLFFYHEIAGGSIKFYPGSDFTITTNYRYKTTYIKGLTAWTLYKRLVEKITGNADYAQSTLLQAYENIIITCGDAIRGLPGASIKTSLSEFYKSLDAVLCAGSGIENDKIVFEERDHFYDFSNPISLGNVKNCKRSYAKELMANTFKIGFPDSKIDDVNGKYEFNNSHLYTSPVTRVVKEYQIQSAYKTSPYLIETKRINLDGKTTTDNDSDNEVFMLNTEAEQAASAEATVSFVSAGNYMICSAALQFVAGQTLTFTNTANSTQIWKVTAVLNLILFQFVYLESIPAGATLTDETDIVITITWQSGIIQKLLRVTYDSIEGIPEESIDSIFNIELFTPKRMLFRHGKWIRSMLHGFETDKLTFQTTEKNPELKTVLGTEVIDEDADVEIGDLDEPLFIPITEECEGEVPIDLVELFEANPNRCFEYTDGYGLTRKGFTVKSALMPNTLQPQGFRLLWVKDNEGAELVI